MLDHSPALDRVTGPLGTDGVTWPRARLTACNSFLGRPAGRRSRKAWHIHSILEAGFRQVLNPLIGAEDVASPGVTSQPVPLFVSFCEWRNVMVLVFIQRVSDGG